MLRYIGVVLALILFIVLLLALFPPAQAAGAPAPVVGATAEPGFFGAVADIIFAALAAACQGMRGVWHEILGGALCLGGLLAAWGMLTLIFLARQMLRIADEDRHPLG